MRIGFIGAGRAGSALATALAEAGHQVVAVADRLPARAQVLGETIGAIATSALRVVEEAEVVFLSVPDDAIAPLAEELACETTGWEGKVFFHLSGLHPARLLRPLTGEENRGSLHPLASLAERRSGAGRLRSCFYTFEGGKKAAVAAQELVGSLGGRLWAIKAEEKPLYHAAAVMASNYTVTLFDVVLGLFARLGLERPAVQEALRPLIEATLANLVTLGSEGALTGPISRGDTETVRTHLLYLARHDEKAVILYRVLGVRTVELARRAGQLTEAAAEELLRLLEGGRA